MKRNINKKWWLAFILAIIAISCDPTLSNEAEWRLYNNTDVTLTAIRSGLPDRSISPGDTAVLVTLLDFDKSREYYFDDFVKRTGFRISLYSEDEQLIAEFTSETIRNKNRKIYDGQYWSRIYKRKGSHQYTIWTYSLTPADLPES
ncbi:MAG: hypothetical protein Q4B16_07575 [Bacteroidia bacterium]|nr:hypothetical protein [Bacteroidia bacterium]